MRSIVDGVGEKRRQDAGATKGRDEFEIEAGLVGEEAGLGGGGGLGFAAGYAYYAEDG
jgi:hypothetical protein